MVHRPWSNGSRCRQVFPHFDPLWVRLDGLDHAPDGSSKKAYSSRMLDRLTQVRAAKLVRGMEVISGNGRKIKRNMKHHLTRRKNSKLLWHSIWNGCRKSEDSCKEYGSGGQAQTTYTL